MKILITGGGSEEPIDTVRSICNFSTGRTSAFLAEWLSQKGNQVTLLQAVRGKIPESNTNLTVKNYRTFKDLAESLKKECRTGNYDAVIHAAAVSDYSVKTIIVDEKEYSPDEIAKVPSGLNLTIKMKKNPKLVDSIKIWAKEGGKKRPLLIAFKLTSKADLNERKQAVQKVFSSTGNLELAPDYVVSNDLTEITGEKHPCRIFKNDMTIPFQTEDLNGLAATLETLI